MEEIPILKRVELLTKAEEDIYNKLVVPYNERRLQSEDFKGSKGFDPKIIDAQNKSTESYKRSKEYIRSSKTSEILEVLMIELIEKADWLEGVYTIRTTEFDDFSNGTDFVLEWEGNPPLRLAVDVTSSATENPRRQENFGSKIEKVEKRLRESRGTNIVYFESQAEKDENGDGVRRKLYNIPKVVLSMDRYNLEKLSKLFTPVLKKEKGAWNILGGLGLREQMIEEFISQLNHSLKVLDENNIDKNIATYRNILAVKNHLIQILGIIPKTRPTTPDPSGSRKILLERIDFNTNK